MSMFECRWEKIRQGFASQRLPLVTPGRPVEIFIIQLASVWWSGEVVWQGLTKLLRPKRRDCQTRSLCFEAGKHLSLQFRGSFVQQQSCGLSLGSWQKLGNLRFKVLAGVQRHFE